jgi:hypothetical protein
MEICFKIALWAFPIMLGVDRGDHLGIENKENRDLLKARQLVLQEFELRVYLYTPLEIL